MPINIKTRMICSLQEQPLYARFWVLAADIADHLYEQSEW